MGLEEGFCKVSVKGLFRKHPQLCLMSCVPQAAFMVAAWVPVFTTHVTMSSIGSFLALAWIQALYILGREAAWALVCLARGRASGYIPKRLRLRLMES